MGSRMTVAPAMYERNWRDGATREHLRRFAPHLLPVR